MKHKNIVYVLIIVIVLVFSIAALGAKNSEESKYIGTWKGSNGQIVILPCHTGEFLNDKGESKMTFTWELDNGYLFVIIDNFPLSPSIIWLWNEIALDDSLCPIKIKFIGKRIEDKGTNVEQFNE